MAWKIEANQIHFWHCNTINQIRNIYYVIVFCVLCLVFYLFGPVVLTGSMSVDEHCSCTHKKKTVSNFSMNCKLKKIRLSVCKGKNNTGSKKATKKNEKNILYSTCSRNTHAYELNNMKFRQGTEQIMWANFLLDRVCTWNVALSSGHYE